MTLLNLWHRNLHETTRLPSIARPQARPHVPAEIKLRAAALFSGSQVEGLAHQPIKTVKVAASAPPRGGKRRG